MNRITERLAVLLALLVAAKCQSTTPIPSLMTPITMAPVITTTTRPDPATTRPDPKEWADNKKGFLDWLLTGCKKRDSRLRNDGCPGEDRHTEYEGYDGFYNNKARPDLGAVDTALLRLLPSAYKDGVYEPAYRPANPLNVSVGIMKGDNGKLSRGGKTAFLVFFGQQVVEEVLDAQRPGCPPEYFNIEIPKNHEYYTEEPKLKQLPFLRSRYDMGTGFSPNNPRQQLNEITPYLDGGLTYGVGKGWADVLRTFSNGTLAPHGKLGWHDDLGDGFPAGNRQRLPLANPPPPTNHSDYVETQQTAFVNRFFKLGNPRGNENPFLLTFGIFFFRWHNALAERLHDLHPLWTGERLFNEARKWVIATHQSIVIYDWLPKWLREDLDEYKGYKPTIDPQISHVFQSAAMRFGHTLVPSGVYLRDKNCRTVDKTLDYKTGGHSSGVRTCNSFWRSPELFKHGNEENFERFLMGLSSQSTEREDNIIVDDLRGRVFGPLEFSRRDLMAINIQRGRDHGLPDYNTARVHFGLPPVSSLEPSTFTRETGTEVPADVLQRFHDIYKLPNETDIWAGGLMETTLAPGQLFRRIIKDQFERIRDGDRFWFENNNTNAKSRQFTADEVARIKQIRIIDILLTVADISLDDIQEDPFTAVHSGNVLKNCGDYLDTNVSCKLHDGTDTECFYLQPLGDNNLENCTSPKTFDYFMGSEVPYILTFFFVAAAVLGLLLTIIFLSRWKESQKARRMIRTTIKVTENDIPAKERVSRIESRYVVINFNTADRRINVKSVGGSLLRTIDLQNLTGLTVKHLNKFHHIVVRVLHHYDLYLKFSEEIYGHKFMSNLEKFCTDSNLSCTKSLESIFSIGKGVTTQKQRAGELAEFSRLVLTKAFEDAETTNAVASQIDMSLFSKNHLFSLQMTKEELAAELGTAPNTLFMEQIFRIMDKDKNGFVLMKEFWDIMVLFAKGSAKEKAKLIFDIYDVSQKGNLTEEDLKEVFKSLLGSEGKGRDVKSMISKLLQTSNLKPGETIDFDKFYELFNGAGNVFESINISAKSSEPSAPSRKNARFSIYGLMNEKKKEPAPVQDKIESALDKEETKVDTNVSELRGHWNTTVRYIYNSQVYLVWIILYTLVMLLIFAERAYYYSVEREHAGLRRIAGYGVTITRGAASAMMFTYSTLLVTMCRNHLNQIRTSLVSRCFPIDDMVAFHKYIGTWALIWTIMHVIGHAINFYHIATQTPSDLTCLFRDFFRQTHVLPKFQYWCWQTITGFTGILLTLQCSVIYIFAYFARRFFFKLFWITHNTYPIFYFLIILHGSGNLVQPPFFHFFFLGPVILFLTDKLVSYSRNTVEIDVLEAQHLPSNVTLLKIRRPFNFIYHAGQWIRIASLAISNQEYHPFTISSAPHEEHLTLHIRAVGPWTMRLRKEYQDWSKVQNKITFRYPKIYIDGPYGEGHQSWWDYDVTILVGGGIGVTPFASILKHIANCCSKPNFNIKTKRVMFLWVTNSQKQFEWLTDILHEVEEQDTRNIIRNHIFITQFKNKFDLRTVFLYMAERNFQRVSGTSLFTGLKAITHFSRPPFPSIFRAVKTQYAFATNVGVFTCGSPSLSVSVGRACQEVNADGGDAIFKHYAENF